jgi:DNA-binding transcriptional MerR regulator
LILHVWLRAFTRTVYLPSEGKVKGVSDGRYGFHPTRILAVRIGELADQLGMTTKGIRFYESTRLLPEPARDTSGYRSYCDEDAERLRFIKTAQRLGLSLDEIKEIIAFRDRGERPCAYVVGVLHRQVADLDERIREMRRLRGELKNLERNAAALDRDDAVYCGLIEHGADRQRGA